MNPALQGLITIVVGVGGCVGYFFFSNQLLDKVIFPARGPNAGKNINRANIVRPWLFLFPAIALLGLYLAYPVVETLRMSLMERLPGGGSKFVGLANYQQMASEPKFWEAMTNNMMWLIVVPAMSTAFGLLAAQLTDRINWGNIAKSLIFMPMAISFVGASVIFKLVYDTRPVEQDQIGILNAIYLTLGGAEPQTWLTVPVWNSFFLMVVLIWIQTGFAMVILSAACEASSASTRSRKVSSSSMSWVFVLLVSCIAVISRSYGGVCVHHTVWVAWMTKEEKPLDSRLRGNDDE